MTINHHQNHPIDYQSILPTYKREYDELWNSSPEFRKLSNKVYRYLDTLPVGSELRFHRYTGEKLKWIMWTCWAYYWDPINVYRYEFSPDFSSFRHYGKP